MTTAEMTNCLVGARRELLEIISKYADEVEAMSELEKCVQMIDRALKGQS